jgi:hypothetical protein
VCGALIHSEDEKKLMNERLTRLGFVEHCVLPDGRIQFSVLLCSKKQDFDVDTNFRKLSISSIGSSTLWE